VKNLNVFAAKAIGATSVALLLTTSAFADSRPQDETHRRDRVDRSRVEQPATRDANRGSDQSSSRRNEGDRNRGNESYRNNGNSNTPQVYRSDEAQQAYRNGTSAEGYRNGGREQANRRGDRTETYRGGDRNQTDRGGSERGRAESHGTYRGGNDRRRTETYRGNNGSYRGNHRDNERVFMRGSISRYVPEHNGYRVFVGGGYDSFWVPASYWRSRGWRVGLSLNLGGIFRAGSVWIDDVPYGYDGYYGSADPYYAGGYGNGYSNGYVRGVVDRVDYRRGTMLVRDDRDGRIVEVDMRSDRYGRLNLDDLRPGDSVELSGEWLRGDIFTAYRVESVREGRY
jgi:hypothetical protein